MTKRRAFTSNRSQAPQRFATLIGVLLFLVALPLIVVAEDSSHLAPPQDPIPATYFGMHFHHVGGVTPWPSAPIPTWRLWDAHTSWPDLEPQKGQWRFQTLDAYLALAAEHHTQVLLPLGLSPQWASARPTERSTYQPGVAAEPRNIDDWRQYVSIVVSHCKGRVYAYEIWNEPNYKSFFTGSLDQMVALTRVASEDIRRIDPQAIIVSPSATMATAGVDWLSQFLRLGGGQYVDVIGFHFYVAPQPPEAMLPLVQRVRQTMIENGVGDKPIWNTEFSWPAPRPFPSEELAAGYLARAYLVDWAAGVRRLYWYAWDNHAFVVTQTTRQDNQTLTPAGRAYGIIENWLVGARMESCDDDSDMWICRLNRNGKQEWIIWSANGNKSFAVPASWKVETITPLLEEPHKCNGSSLEVGPLPILLTSNR